MNIKNNVLSVGFTACVAVMAASPAWSAVGRTQGSFAVTPTGAATYTIPIFTPPGPRGMQPSVALVYNSNAGVGYVGRGWSLAGFSAINRCIKTTAQDGPDTNAAIVLAPSDGYCMDGNRLRVTSGANTYGLDGSSYQTEFADFSLVTASSLSGVTGIAAFTVKRKDGSTFTYGGTSDSRVLASGTDKVHTWMLSEIRDRSGNKVIFTYKNPSTTTGATHPVRIQWAATTYNGSTYLYSMDFAYTAGGNALETSTQGYIAGTLQRDTDLLDSITVSESSVAKRKYFLSYGISPTTKGKRLESVQECPNADSPTTSNCLSPTQIGYQDGASGTGAMALGVGDDVTGVNVRHDFNGDGLRDIAYRLGTTWYVRLASPSGYSNQYSTGVTADALIAGDFLGDGRARILALSGSAWKTYGWNGSVFAEADLSLTTSTVPANTVLADVNADGRDDLLSMAGFGSSGNYTVVTRPNTSIGGIISFGSPVSSSITPNTNASLPPGYYLSNPGSVYLGSSDIYPGSSTLDLNGDGREELFTVVTFEICLPHPESPDPYCSPAGATTRQFLISQGGGQFSVVDSDLGYAFDMNDDGCTDSLMSNGAGISGCNGAVVSTINLGSNVFTKGAADWDGDGRKDVLALLSGQSVLKVALSTGNGLSDLHDTGISTNDLCLVVATDANGDGLDEFGCWRYHFSLILYYHNGTVLPDLATSFQDGYGNLANEIKYGDISQGNYTPYTDAVSPQIDVKSGRRVVTEVSHSDGVGGTFKTTYTYFGGIEDTAGRGFLTFQKVKAVDSRSGVPFRIDYYDKTFPVSGALIKTETYQPDATLITQRNITMVGRTLDDTVGNRRYFIYPQSDSVSTREVDGALKGVVITEGSESRTYDDWGNLTASTRIVTDKDTSSSNPYLNHSWTQTMAATFYSATTSNWCLDLPHDMSVTSSATGEAPITRSTSFTPDSPACRIEAETTGSGNRQVDTTYGYDAYGNVDLISVTGRNSAGGTMSSRVSHITWGSANGSLGGTGQFPVSESNALSQTTTRTFHPTFGQLATETDPNGIVVVNNSFDPFGRVTSTKRADGTSTAYAYEPCASQGCQNGDPASDGGLDRLVVIASERDASDAPFRTSYSHFDQFDRPIVQSTQMLSGSYNRVGRQYDALGRLYRESAPCNQASCSLYWVTHTYDVLGRLTSQSRPVKQGVATAATTTFTYQGRELKTVDPLSKQTRKFLDVNGWLRRSEDHYGYYQSFFYDPAGSLKQVTDSLGNTLFTANYTYGIQAFQDSTYDMDLGARTYWHNSLGDLTAWSDAKGQSFNQTYDPLSRVLTREDVTEGITTAWTWDDTDHGIGRLKGVSMTGYSELYTYDNKGRLKKQKTTTDQPYEIDFDYNNQGQLDTLTYPVSTASTRFRLQYGYAYGLLQSVKEFTGGSAGSVYWTANTQNPRGQVTLETLGNEVVTERIIDAVTGRTDHLRSGKGGGSALQNQSYSYDAVGNVTLRQESNLGLNESFEYDALYRLEYSTLGSTVNLDLSYDAMGNITSRSDIAGGAPWSYHNTLKHRLLQAGSADYAYSYDDNGNVTSRFGHGISWSSYNYPTLIEGAGKSLTFYYGPDRQRYKQVYASGTGTETTHYVGGILEKVALPGGVIDWRHYVRAGGQTVAVVSRRSTGTNAVHYVLEDHQGSPANLLLPDGSNYVAESFTAFGARRDAATWTDTCQCDDLYKIKGVSRMGYTGHEAIGGVSMGLNHMNGRVQDAILGRFLSPDPYVPNPDLTQSFNRYSYVRNNPLTWADPSGFFDTGCVVDPATGACWTGVTISGGCFYCVAITPGDFAWLFPDYYSEVETPEPGDTGSGPSDPPQSPVGQCTSPAISASERDFARDGDRRRFWESRASRGDPMAATALSILDNVGMGKVANALLLEAIETRSHMGIRSPESVGTEMDTIGMQLMEAHRDAVVAFGHPSPSQIALYHWSVFALHGLNSNAFGGTPFVGAAWEANVTAGLWLQCH